ncbi:MAG TPA: hypothetical protein VER79_12140 [Candidatus Limnocylindrales bacterium]|nr:hypothetical protein [Candidatus Limnocylindrales bacterium]
MDTVCAAGLCLVAGLVVLGVLMAGPAGETHEHRPDARGYDLFALHRQSDEPGEEEQDRSSVYYHRAWMDESGWARGDQRDGGLFMRR